MTPQQEHAIAETALRMRQEMLEARADLYALLDAALLRDLTPTPPVL